MGPIIGRRTVIKYALVAICIVCSYSVLKEMYFIYNSTKGKPIHVSTFSEESLGVFSVINKTTQVPHFNAAHVLHEESEAPVITRAKPDSPVITRRNPDPSPPLTVMINNRSVIVTAPPMPNKVSILKGNPDICRSSRDLKWIIYIHTAPKNTAKRNTMRHTWGNTYLFSDRRTAIIFLVGVPRLASEREIIDDEYRRYGDIVQGDFTEDYRNLTYKGILGFQFISLYCSHVPYTIKSDDDVFANIFKIMHLTEEQGPLSRFLMCFHWHGMIVNRPGGPIGFKRWWLPLDVMPGKKTFPPYCAGLGWVYSTNIISELANYASATPFLWVDDVFLSGLVMNQVANLTVINLFKVVPMKTMLGDVRPFNASEYIFSHKKPKTVEQRWNQTLHQLDVGILQNLNVTALGYYPDLLKKREKLMSSENKTLDMSSYV